MSYSKINTNKDGEIVIKFGGNLIKFRKERVPVTTFKFTRKTSTKNIKYLGIWIDNNYAFGQITYREQYEVHFNSGRINKFDLITHLRDIDDCDDIPTSRLKIKKYNDVLFKTF